MSASRWSVRTADGKLRTAAVTPGPHPDRPGRCRKFAPPKPAADQPKGSWIAPSRDKSDKTYLLSMFCQSRSWRPFAERGCEDRTLGSGIRPLDALSERILRAGID